MPSENSPIPVVFDTNVLVSAFTNGGIPAQALQLAISSKCELYLSLFILDELRRVLILKLHHSERLVDSFISELEENALIIQPRENVSVIKGKINDNRILEVAIVSDAVFLVSGDRKHILPIGKIGETQIVTPKIFLQVMEEL